MPPSANHEAVAMCRTKGAGFVLHPAGPDESAEHLVSASLAMRIAQRTAAWLLDHGIENTGFCVRTRVPLSNDGNCDAEITVEADLRAIALDERAGQGLARFVESRAHLSRRPFPPIRWSWRMV